MLSSAAWCENWRHQLCLLLWARLLLFIIIIIVITIVITIIIIIFFQRKQSDQESQMNTRTPPPQVNTCLFVLLEKESELFQDNILFPKELPCEKPVIFSFFFFFHYSLDYFYNSCCQLYNCILHSQKNVCLN